MRFVSCRASWRLDLSFQGCCLNMGATSSRLFARATLLTVLLGVVAGSICFAMSSCSSFAQLWCFADFLCEFL